MRPRLGDADFDDVSDPYSLLLTAYYFNPPVDLRRIAVGAAEIQDDG